MKERGGKFGRLACCKSNGFKTRVERGRIKMINERGDTPNERRMFQGTNNTGIRGEKERERK